MRNKFQNTLYGRQKWTTDWQGPQKICWCSKTQYTSKNWCITCRDQLSEWVTMERCKPYGIENKIPADWTDEVEQLYLKTQHIDQHFNTFNKAQQMINSAFKIVRCEEY